MSAPDPASHCARRSKIRLGLTYLLCLAICLPFHILWHEVMGHSLVGVLAGGQVTHVEVLGMKLWPEVCWIGWSGAPGRCGVEGITTAARWDLHLVAGPLSTLSISVLAVFLLWVRRWRGLLRVVLVCLALWWADLLSETMASFGIPRLIFWGPVRPVHFRAAVQLGIPPSLFQIFGLATSMFLLMGLVARLILDRQRTKKQSA